MSLVLFYVFLFLKMCLLFSLSVCSFFSLILFFAFAFLFVVFLISCNSRPKKRDRIHHMTDGVCQAARCEPMAGFVCSEGGDAAEAERT